MSRHSDRYGSGLPSETCRHSGGSRCVQVCVTYMAELPETFAQQERDFLSIFSSLSYSFIQDYVFLQEDNLVSPYSPQNQDTDS